MSESVWVTTLVENTVNGPNLRAEHGLAFLIRAGRHHLLLDTGQSGLVLDNAQKMGLHLEEVSEIVVSHGHYDHAGGLKTALKTAPSARLFIHPAAFSAKYAANADGSARAIGITGENAQAAQNTGSPMVWTTQPSQVAEGIFVTGEIPREHSFEDTGGRFFLDQACAKPDPLFDDQALYFDTRLGLVVLLGCAHAGVVNTLDYVQHLTGGRPIYAVMGGLHLLSASSERIAQTIAAFRRWDIQRLILAHCTGLPATVQLWAAFPGRCSACPVGTTIAFQI